MVFIMLIFTARAKRLLCCRRMVCGEGKVGMGGATEMEMVTLFLSRLEDRCCCSSVCPRNTPLKRALGVINTTKSSQQPLTSVQSSEAELGVPVQLLQTRRSGTGMKNVVLLMPWSLIVSRQLALNIQVRHR